MSPKKVTEYGFRRGEREIGPVFVIKQTTEHPLDEVVRRLEELLEKKGKKNLPIIPEDVAAAASAPVIGKLQEVFPELIMGAELSVPGDLDAGEATLAIKNKGIGKEEWCLALYNRNASTALNENKGLRAQFLGVIANEVNKLWFS